MARPKPLLPLLVVTGSMGAGKSTVMAEASDLLAAAGVRHAAVDFDALGICHAERTDGLALRNLSAIVSNFVAAGASRLIVAAALETAGQLRAIVDATAATNAVVCRLRAAVDTMEARVRVREPGMLGSQFVERVAVLERILDDAAVEDFSVLNDGRPVTEAAREMLVRAGWLCSL